MAGVSSVNPLRPIAEPASPAEVPERADDVTALPTDKVTISPEARAQQRKQEQATQRTLSGKPLDERQQHEVRELQARDAHVRAHEAAHQAAAGGLAGPATYTYRVGPDGRSYAVGGEVPIRSAGGRTPDETIAIARQVRAAALAPTDPSSADLSAAAAAGQAEMEALQQKWQQQARAISWGRAASQAAATASASPPPAPMVPSATLAQHSLRAPEPEPFL